jgi:hypothetical protein
MRSFDFAANLNLSDYERCKYQQSRAKINLLKTWWIFVAEIRCESRAVQAMR